MSNYFKKLPNFDYVSRLPNAIIGDYMPGKNLFKKGFLREVSLTFLLLNL